MAGSIIRRRARRRAAALFLAFCLIIPVAGCGKKEGQSPQGGPAVAEVPSGNAADETRQGSLPVPSGGRFSVFVTPSSPSRIAPPSISVKSPPKHGAEVLLVRWFVNGGEQESGTLLSPSRFQRGDRIRANVKLGAGGEEIILTTPEVVAVNALPGVTDVRIEPRAPFSGSTVRAVVQARDPDGDPLTFRYRWYVNDSPVAGNGESLALTGVKKGSWVHVTVTPNDGFADGAWRDSPRYQVVNALPVVKSVLPKELPQGRRFIYRIVAEDPDGDPLTYSLSKGPSGMRLEGSTLEWQVPEESIGADVEAVVVISDNDGGRTVQTISMTIQPPK
ncbi:MAG: hypothetical protein ACYDAX_04295 [Desulfobacteria bacterium]